MGRNVSGFNNTGKQNGPCINIVPKKQLKINSIPPNNPLTLFHIVHMWKE